MIIVEHGKKVSVIPTKNAKLALSNKKCPRCGKPGTGPYERWVKNSRGKRYEPYLYFAHRENGKLKWCYLGRVKKELDNKTEQLEAP
jgi:hypothetical protein